MIYVRPEIKVHELRPFSIIAESRVNVRFNVSVDSVWDGVVREEELVKEDVMSDEW